MTDKQILELIRKNAVNVKGKQKLVCKKAWELSAQFDIPLKKIGEVCNSNSIKVCDCSLGCF